MGDLISRQDTLQLFETAFENNWTVSDTMDALENLPSVRSEQQWIPCSERLPEEHEWIGTKKFGTTISDIILITFDVKGERFVKPMSLQNGALGPSDKQTMDVFYKEWEMLAWMPLPKPWRGEEE